MSRTDVVRIVTGLAIVTAVAVAGIVLRRPPPPASALVQALRAGRITIDAFLRAERAAAPRLFDARFLTQRERGLRSSGVNVSNLELINVTDGSWWVRTRIGFAAPVPKQPDAGTARWRQVVYYHTRGAAVLGSICSQAATDCAGLNGILDTADQNLRDRVAAGDLDYVLPENGSCTTESMPVPGGSDYSRVRACYYGPGRVLTLMRLDSASTITDLLADRTDTP